MLLECHRDQRQIGAECCSYNKRKNRNEKKLLLIKGCKSTLWIICPSKEKIPNSDTLLCLARATECHRDSTKAEEGTKKYAEIMTELKRLNHKQKLEQLSLQ